MFANEFQEYYTFMCEKAENTGTNRLQMQYEVRWFSIKQVVVVLSSFLFKHGVKRKECKEVSSFECTHTKHITL